jgi:hypothetical protein
MGAITSVWSAAQWALNFALAASPLGLAVVAIGAIVLGVGLIIKGLDGLGVKWSEVWGGIKNFFQRTWQTIKDIGTGLKELFEPIAAAILAPFKGAFNGIARAWNATIGKIGFTIPDWVPVLGGKGFHVPSIPLLAKGANVAAGKPYIVGDQGPELFFPGQSGRVSSNQDSTSWAGGGDVYVMADFGDGVRQLVRAERIGANEATRSYVQGRVAA